MDQFSLFSSEQSTSDKTYSEIWVCQRTVKLDRTTVNVGEKVKVISRSLDTFTNLNSIQLIHLENSAHINTIESFFIKYFYLLTKKG